jgi:hypothetical protein
MLIAKTKLPVRLEACIDEQNRMTAHTALDLMARVLDQTIKEISK